MSNAARVYFPVEGLGLGHFNRAGKITRGMIADGFNVSVASGSLADPERFFAGAALCVLPPYVIDVNGKGLILLNDGRTEVINNFDPLKWQAERSDAHVKNIQSIKPDILITEFWPFDRPNFDQEMHVALKTARSVSPNGLRCVSTREILDTPIGSNTGTEAAHKRQREALAIINDNFHVVFVHGDPHFMPFKETFPLVDDIKAEVIYTGYVIDDLPKRQVVGKEAPILVSCGSGFDGEEMIYSFLTAWQSLLEKSKRDLSVRAVTDRPVRIISGPRFNNFHYENVSAWAHDIKEKYHNRITVEKYRGNYTQVLAESAFSISFAGYNTTLETLAIGVPSVLIPKYALSGGRLLIADEQLHRLQRLQEQNLAVYAHPKDVQNSTLFADMILGEFTKQTDCQKPVPQLNFNGAENTINDLQRLPASRNHRKFYHIPPVGAARL